MFGRWVKLLGEDSWLSDPRFKDDQSRGDNGEIVSKRVSEWTAERTTAEALGELEKAKIPAGPLYSPQQALEDPHIRAAGLLRDTEYPGLARPAPLGDRQSQLRRRERSAGNIHRVLPQVRTGRRREDHDHARWQ